MAIAVMTAALLLGASAWYFRDMTTAGELRPAGSTPAAGSDATDLRERAADAAQEIEKALAASAAGDFSVISDPATGGLSTIRAGVGGDLYPQTPAGLPPAAKFAAFLAEHGALLGIEDPARQLKPLDDFKDQYGFSHVRYQQLHGGLPVLGAVLQGHVSPDGRLTAVKGKFVPDIDLPASAQIARDDAVRSAVLRVGQQQPAALKDVKLTASSAKLVVYRTGLTNGTAGANHLAYEVQVTVSVHRPDLAGAEAAIDGPSSGSVSGVALDPLGLTNGTAVPATVNVRLKTWKVNGFTGLSDISGHPAQGMIEFAVRERLVDGLARGLFKPDAALTRGQLADYLVAGAGIRQYLPLDRPKTFGDVGGALVPFVEAATARGAALKDRGHRFDGVIRTTGGKFRPGAAVNRGELAYSLVQGLGLQEAARAFSGELTVRFNDQRIPLEDAGEVPAELRGYVQLALELPVMNAFFTLEQGPFDLAPTIKARFRPAMTVTRAAYASYANHYYDVYRQTMDD
ncbi:MAG: S-layer homology domain-containing protein [Steroidobacteraceae bacterium]